jgi:ketosteroid isomerase-like protein
MPMKSILMKALLACACLCAAGAAAAADDLGKLAAEVRATEIAFAQTLADRDVKTFTRMIAPDVIWLADIPLRGPAQVLTRWQKYFDAPQPPFSWSPETVEVQSGGKLALSTGPVLNSAGQRVGTYTSIWRHEPDGRWRMIFDRGCPACDCATAKASAATN